MNDTLTAEYRRNLAWSQEQDEAVARLARLGVALPLELEKIFPGTDWSVIIPDKSEFKYNIALRNIDNIKFNGELKAFADLLDRELQATEFKRCWASAQEGPGGNYLVINNAGYLHDRAADIAANRELQHGNCIWIVVIRNFTSTA